MKKILVMSILACAAVLEGYSQGAEVMYPSPSSMALVSQANHTTGHVNVSVPLFDLRYSDINIPVVLNYNTSGIKVEERPTEVGYGWRLSAGGKITRVVKRRPDDITQSTQLWGNNLLNLAQSFYARGNPKYLYYNELDLEPDLFYYEIPGKSGMFVLDANSVPHTIPYDSSVKISIHGGAYFLIRDNTGMIYTFGRNEGARESTTTKYENHNVVPYQSITQEKPADWPTNWDWPLDRSLIYETSSRPVGWSPVWPWPVRRGSSKPSSWPSHWPWPVVDIYAESQMETLNYVSTWHLSEIADYRDRKITFTYANGASDPITSVTETDTYRHPNWERITTRNEVTTQTATKVLSKITAGVQSLVFTMMPNNCLGKIEYSVNLKVVGTRQFVYATSGLGRCFLTSIVTGSSERSYYFEYHKPNEMPAHDSWCYDSWGYFNGKSNSVVHTPTIKRNYNGADNLEFPGINKMPDLTYAKYGILTAVENSMGGRTEYEYGLNYGYQGIYKVPIGGLKVEKIKYLNQNGGQVGSITYQYDDPVIGGYGYPQHTTTSYDPNFKPEGSEGTSHHIWYYVASSSKPLWDYTFLTGLNVVYGKITEVAADGSKIEYEYSTPGTNGYEDKPSYIWKYNDSGSVGIDAAADGTYMSDLFSPPLTSRFWKHGLLLGTTKYDPRGNIIEETTYNYQQSHERNTVIKSYAPHFYGYMLKLFFEYEWESQPVLVHSVTTKAFDAPQTTTIYTYDSQLALPVTVMQQSGGNSTETSYRYAHMFTYPATGAIPARDLNEKGILAPIETLTLRNGKVVSAEYTEYAHVALDNGLSVVLPSKKYRMPLVAGPIEVTNVSRATYNAGWRYDPKYELSEQYEYDLSGNLVCIRTLHGAKTAFVYLDDFKIAEVANAGADEIFHTSFEKLMSNPAVTPKTGDRALRGSYRFTLSGFPHGEYVMTYWSCPGNSVWTKNTETVTVNASAVTVTIPDRGWIDELSVLPKDARIKTYTYRTGVGPTSETDHNGRTTYREYDAMGRPSRVLDNERRVLETYQYHTKN